jgi:hypothetical protein
LGQPELLEQPRVRDGPVTTSAIGAAGSVAPAAVASNAFGFGVFAGFGAGSTKPARSARRCCSG